MARQCLDALVTVVVDGRSLPMFAMLFGYGMVQVLSRQSRGGAPWPAARRVLLRRNAFLIVFGTVHAALLFKADILGPCGAAGLVVTLLFLRRSTRVLASWIVISGVALVLLSVAFIALLTGTAPEQGEASYLLSAYERIINFSGSVAIAPVLLLGPALIGVLMARAQPIDRPWDHRVVLRRIAGTCIPVGLLGACPSH